MAEKNSFYALFLSTLSHPITHYHFSDRKYAGNRRTDYVQVSPKHTNLKQYLQPVNLQLI